MSTESEKKRVTLYRVTTGEAGLSVAFVSGNGHATVQPLFVPWSDLQPLTVQAVRFGFKQQLLQTCGKAEPRNGTEARAEMERIVAEWRKGVWDLEKEVPVDLIVEAIQLSAKQNKKPCKDEATLRAMVGKMSLDDVKKLYKQRPDVNAAMITILARNKPEATDAMFDFDA